MPDIYFFNGNQVKRQHGALSPFDRSFSLGDGIFETVKVVRGRPVWLDEHLERMERSALFARIVCGFTREEIGHQCAQLIAATGISDGFLRITLSRGDSALGSFYDLPKDGSLAIIAGKAAIRSAPAKAAFAPWRINEADPAVRHKTTSRFSAVIAAQTARDKGMDELVFLNTQGNLAEGIVSNLFWTKDGELFTPSPECGLLCGIARGKLIEACNALGIKLHTGAYSPETLLDADSLFFTNSIVIMRYCNEIEGEMKKKCTVVQSIEKAVIAVLSE